MKGGRGGQRGYTCTRIQDMVKNKTHMHLNIPTLGHVSVGHKFSEKLNKSHHDVCMQAILSIQWVAWHVHTYLYTPAI